MLDSSTILKSYDTLDRLSGNLLTGWKRVVFIAAIFIVGSVCCGIYSTSIGPFNDWDLKNYQYYSPYSLLTGRYDIDYAPAQIQTFLNPAPFVPFYLLTTHLKPVVAGFIMGAIHGLAAGLLFLTAMAMFSSLSPAARILLSLPCAALGVYGPTFLAHMGGSGADNIASLFILAGLYLLVRAIRYHGSPDAREARLSLLIGSVLIGIAAGLKLVCVVFLIGYGTAVLVTGRGFRSRLAAVGLFGIAGAAGVLISRGYWMGFLWSRFGSPLFPFYNRTFGSPYYSIKNFADDQFIPKTLKDALLLPFSFLSENTYTQLSHDFRDIRYAMVYVLVLLCLATLATGLVMLLLRRPLPKYRMPGRPEIFLLIFFIVSYVIWQMKFAILRYTVPLELVAPILIVVLIRLMLPWTTMRQIATIAAFASIAVITHPWSLAHGSWSSAYIEVDAPQFENPDETLVIMPRNWPLAYVIPCFQPEVRFIGLMNTYSYLESNRPHSGIKEMLDIVKAHTGPIYLLSTNQRRPSTLEIMMPHNIVLSRELTDKMEMGRFKTSDLEEISDIVLPVVSKHEKSKFYLWPVEIYKNTERRRRGSKPDPRLVPDPRSKVKKIRRGSR